LRGGQGDEYPIQLFATHGFAVLSFERPWDRALLAVSRDYDDVETRGWVDLRDRRYVLRNLEGGIDALNRMEIIDPDRIAITGLSDGGETATFALIHSSIPFAAASVSWTLYSPMLPALMGPKFQRDFDEWNIPWDRVSIARNAERIRTPLLIHVADVELLGEVDSVRSLRAARRPVEMHVFPDEEHIKWQPAHRYYIYRRNLQWFQFWLQGVEVPDPVDQHQYERWRALRGQAAQ
jgi:dipeptidyl aminopeptidase/acylaminoacyl peptidase